MDKIDNNGKKIKFISCEVILDEVKDLLPGNWEVTSLEKRLHERSDELTERKEIRRQIAVLQEEKLERADLAIESLRRIFL